MGRRHRHNHENGTWIYRKFVFPPPTQFSLPPQSYTKILIVRKIIILTYLLTTVVAGSQALSLLTPEMRNIVRNSKIEYPPHCFKWMFNAHSTRLGHSIETEGLEKPLDELKPWVPEKICRYPMVWKNPVTGEECEYHFSCYHFLNFSRNIESLDLEIET